MTKANVIWLAVAALAAIAVPWVIGNEFYINMATQVLIYALFALSINMMLGYGGMVSLGHAGYRGIAGYACILLVINGFDQLSAAIIAVLFSTAVAGFFGVLSLRAPGLGFIMITLAFAQMVYYIAIGLDRYGGDDGLTIYKRSQFGDWINLSNKTVFYYLCLVLLLVVVYFVWRLVNSRFGLAIQGARSNERRMRAIGFPTFRYKLACFVIAGMICGLSGVLLANHTDFISPAMMHWTRSGDLIVMAVLGGMGSVFGPVIGSVALLVLEEVLPYLIGFFAKFFTTQDVSAAREYWQLILGPMLLLIVLYARGGIDGLFGRARRG